MHSVTADQSVVKGLHWRRGRRCPGVTVYRWWGGHRDIFTFRGETVGGIEGVGLQTGEQSKSWRGTVFENQAWPRPLSPLPSPPLRHWNHCTASCDQTQNSRTRAFDAEQWGGDGRDIGVLQSSSESLVNVGKTGKPRAGWAVRREDEPTPVPERN